MTRTHHETERSFRAFCRHLGKLWVRMFQTISLTMYLCLSFIVLAIRDWRHVEGAASNCAIYAFAQEYNHGGAVLIKKSLYGWWWHIQWLAPDGSISEFNPLKRKKPRWYPPIVFRGKVARRPPTLASKCEHCAQPLARPVPS